MKKINLTQGFTAIVDDEDHDSVSKFKWYAMASRRKDGTIRSVYAIRRVRVDGAWTTQLMHRFILNPPYGMEVDHIDGNGLNNSRENIRICTSSENQHNQRPRVDGSSKFKGVRWYKRLAKWSACIGAHGKQVHIGLFHDEEAAAKAYDAAAINFFGAFARTNFKEAHND